jgi:hypothetical protein
MIIFLKTVWSTIALVKSDKPNDNFKGIVIRYGYSDDFFENLSGDPPQKWKKI